MGAADWCAVVVVTQLFDDQAGEHQRDPFAAGPRSRRIGRQLTHRPLQIGTIGEVR